MEAIYLYENGKFHYYLNQLAKLIYEIKLQPKIVGQDAHQNLRIKEMLEKHGYAIPWDIRKTYCLNVDCPLSDPNVGWYSYVEHDDKENPLFEQSLVCSDCEQPMKFVADWDRESFIKEDMFYFTSHFEPPYC